MVFSSSRQGASLARFVLRNAGVRRSCVLGIGCVLAGWTQGCSTVPRTAGALSNLDATLWSQTAAEHDAAVRAVYALAQERLTNMARSAASTAALEQESGGGGFGKPPAIICDVDETLLDNSPFQGELVWRGVEFDSGVWRRWVLLAKAKALPGAVEFCQAAREAEIAILYVTNRGEGEPPEERQRQEQATRRNLLQEGFPVTEEVDCVLTPGERADWGKDKSSRRAWVSARYRIVALVGDDLGDFVSVDQLTLDQRKALAQQHSARWGTCWFLTPNPMYGSWLRAVKNSQPPGNVTRVKLNTLQRVDPRPACD